MNGEDSDDRNAIFEALATEFALGIDHVAVRTRGALTDNSSDLQGTGDRL
jgi:hypothetical protein